MANRKALSRLGWMLGRMHDEAKRRKAAVFEAEESTKESPFKIFVFTMLSSRTRDETTMKAVERLFSLANTPKQVAALGQSRLEKILYGVGFYRTKARNLVLSCKIIEKGGGVPNTLEGLLELPGVGRKTANIVLARAFGKNALGVDIHVHRISNRIGLAKTRKPEETEQELLKILPKMSLPKFNRTLVAFGQTVCLPRRPLCKECPVRKLCMRIGVA